MSKDEAPPKPTSAIIETRPMFETVNKKHTQIGGVIREASLHGWWLLSIQWIKNNTINKKPPFRKEHMANVEGKIMPTRAKPTPPPHPDL